MIPKEEFIKYKKELLIYHELEYLEDFKNYAAPINEKLEKSFESSKHKGVGCKFKIDIKIIDNFCIGTLETRKN